jgi:hypothetical protein
VSRSKGLLLFVAFWCFRYSLEKTLMSWPRPAQLISSLRRLSDAIQQQFAAVQGDLSLIEFAERLLMRRRIEHCD